MLSPTAVLADLLAEAERVQLRLLGEAQVRGKSEALAIFTLD